MPIPCQGFTFTYGGAQLAEIQTLELDYATNFGELTLNRSGGVSAASTGTIVLNGTSPQGMSQSQYRYGGTLTIACPKGTSTLTLFQGYCLYDGMAVRARANEAVSFAYRFRVWSMAKALTTT